MIGEGTALTLALTRAQSAIRRSVDAVLTVHHSLNYTEFLALAELGAVRGARLRPADLGRRLALTASGISRLLSRLETSGYVERAGHDRDARSDYVRLTSLGRTTIEAAVPAVEAAVDDVLSRSLSDAERVTLVGFFERLGYG